MTDRLPIECPVCGASAECDPHTTPDGTECEITMADLEEWTRQGTGRIADVLRAREDDEDDEIAAQLLLLFDDD